VPQMPLCVWLSVPLCVPLCATLCVVECASVCLYLDAVTLSCAHAMAQTVYAHAIDTDCSTITRMCSKRLLNNDTVYLLHAGTDCSTITRMSRELKKDTYVQSRVCRVTRM